MNSILWLGADYGVSREELADTSSTAIRLFHPAPPTQPAPTSEKVRDSSGFSTLSHYEPVLFLLGVMIPTFLIQDFDLRESLHI